MTLSGRVIVCSLLVYVTFLPLALWPKLHWATLAVAPLIALLLCGIENIGVHVRFFHSATTQRRPVCDCL